VLTPGKPAESEIVQVLRHGETFRFAVSAAA